MTLILFLPLPNKQIKYLYVMKKILFYLKKRVKEELCVECILYANGYGELARSDGAVELLERIRGEEEHLQ